MKANFLTDYLACILFRLSGPVVRRAPKGCGLFLGRLIGDIFYYFDYKHKARVFSNIKTAFSDSLSLRQINDVARGFYRNLGQNFIELLFIPLIDARYIEKYINIEGRENAEAAFKRGKGVIFAAVHEGSWELSNLISLHFGFPFVFFGRMQKYPRLNKLLNSYRRQKGCRVVERTIWRPQGKVGAMKYLIENLKNNHSLGMTIDQGGKNGIPVVFFGKDASMPTGAVRLALKYGAVILPVFFARLDGAHHKVIIGQPFDLQRTADNGKDIRDNLQALVKIFEDWIKMFPQEYLWLYKIWKYSRTRQILILSDGKTGHLRQSEAMAKITADYLKDKNIEAETVIKEIRFKNKISRYSCVICGLFSGKYQCQGCGWCLKKFAVDEDYKFLRGINADIIISSGSSMAAVNYIVSRQNQAKSIAVMRPSMVSMDKFSLIVMPRHDNPPKRKNVVVTDGALNLIDDEYLKTQTNLLLNTYTTHTSVLVPRLTTHNFHIGLLIGGETINFHLSKKWMKDIIAQLKHFAQTSGAGILVSTSRRTPRGIEALVKQEFASYPHCPLLIVANERNIACGIGGILGLSKIVVITPESISMISEAASSGRYVIVCKAQVDSKHDKFLDCLSEKKYIYPVETGRLSEVISKIRQEQPAINRLDDRTAVKEAVSRVI